jgi:hypothetical protein
MGREDEIKIIAYRIWEEEGCCDGHNEEYWLKAEVIWEEKREKALAPSATKATPKRRVTKKDIKKRPAKKH